MTKQMNWDLFNLFRSRHQDRPLDPANYNHEMEEFDEHYRRELVKEEMEYYVPATMHREELNHWQLSQSFISQVDGDDAIVMLASFDSRSLNKTTSEEICDVCFAYAADQASTAVR